MRGSYVRNVPDVWENDLFCQYYTDTNETIYVQDSLKSDHRMSKPRLFARYTNTYEMSKISTKVIVLGVNNMTGTLLPDRTLP